MYRRIFKNKLKELLFNNTQNNHKIISRSKNFDLTLNNSLINTQIKIKKDYNILPLKHISKFNLNSNALDTLKQKNNNINKDINKILDLMNNINNINNIYCETIDNINNNKKRYLKRNNTFQSIKIKNDIYY